MKYKTLLFVGLFFISLISLVAAADWRCDSVDCPNEAHSQNCDPGDVECGYSGGTVYCYLQADLDPPASVGQTHTGSYSVCDGGYVINCEAYDGSEPHCDNSGNYWCDRKDACYNIGRITNCTGGSWNTAVCDYCRSGYVYCDGSYTDGDGCEVRYGVTNCASGAHNNINASCDCVCDSGYLDCDEGGAGIGNGCEVQDGGSCTVGSLSGTYDGCTCIVDKSYFETGTNTEYQTNTSGQHFLWGTDYGAIGDLLRLNNTNYGIFSINASGCIIWMDGTTACTAPTGGGMDYTNIAMTNISETWGAGLNVSTGSGGWFKGFLNWSWLQNIPSYVKDWSLHFTHLSNFTDDILWTSGFNTSGDSKWLDDTTIGNCSVIGSCNSVAYMDYVNSGGFNITGYFKADIVQANTYFYAPFGAAIPSYTFTSDQDTGMLRPGTNRLALKAGGSNMLELNFPNRAVEIPSNFKLQFRDADLNISSPADGMLKISVDEFLEIDSPQTNITGNITLPVNSYLCFGSSCIYNNGTHTIWH